MVDNMYTCTNIKNMNLVFDKLKESTQSKALLFLFMIYISPPDNSVTLNGVHPTYKQIMNLAKIGKHALVDSLNELEELKIIKRVRVGRNFIIYLNPYIFNSNKKIDKKVIDMFKDWRSN